MVLKRGKKRNVEKDFYLLVFSLLKQGLNPSKISQKLSISKQTLNYHLSLLKKKNLIEKIGYGTWEIKEVKKQEQEPIPHLVGSLVQDSIRGHGFAFKICLNNLQNWEKRENYLINRNIPYKKINPYLIQVIVKNHIIWLSEHAIIVYFPKDKSYYTKTVKEAQEQAIYDFKSIISTLLRLMRINLPKHDFCIFKHHYSLVENELAKDYNQRKEKLILESKGKVWGLIDFSLNINEFETISKDSDKDMKKIVTYFNEVKELEDYTPKKVMEMMVGLTQNQLMFDKNFQSHLEVLNKLGKAVDELREQIKENKK